MVQRLATMPVFAETLKVWGPYLPHHWSDWSKMLDLVLWVPKQHVYQVSLKSETVGFNSLGENSLSYFRAKSRSTGPALLQRNNHALVKATPKTAPPNIYRRIEEWLSCLTMPDLRVVPVGKKKISSYP